MLVLNNLGKSSLKRPNWIRVKAAIGNVYKETEKLIRKNNLNTVCEEASCPNIGECWSKKHATIMILGSICTRACTFCDISTGRPDLLDPNEPERVANAMQELDLNHVVITSVDRDDLPDGGAKQFADTILAIRKYSPSTTIEVLTPDFLRKEGALEIVVNAKPDVFNHNLETVPRLYRVVRPGARYFHSLELLSRVKKIDPTIFTKSGVMVGLGEEKEEIIQIMDDFRIANIDFMTIGQYLQPSPIHHPIDRFVTPKEFQEYASIGKGKGFLLISSSPLTRSSYHADKDFKRLQEIRFNEQSKLY